MPYREVLATWIGRGAVLILLAAALIALAAAAIILATMSKAAALVMIVVGLAVAGGLAALAMEET